MMKNEFCSQCGAPLQSMDQVCSVCGKQVAGMRQPPPNQQTRVPPPPILTAKETMPTMPEKNPYRAAEPAVKTSSGPAAEQAEKSAVEPTAEVAAGSKTSIAGSAKVTNRVKISSTAGSARQTAVRSANLPLRLLALLIILAAIVYLVFFMK